MLQLVAEMPGVGEASGGDIFMLVGLVDLLLSMCQQSRHGAALSVITHSGPVV